MASAGLCDSRPVVRSQPTAGMASNPCQTDIEKLPHRKHKHDGEKVEWKDSFSILKLLLLEMVGPTLRKSYS